MREGDHVYFLAPPDRVQALDRFFAERPPQASPDAALVEDFFVPGDVTLGALAEIYGLTIPPEDAGTVLADYFAAYFIKHPPRVNDAIPLGPVKLVAHTVTDDRVVTVGLQLAEPGAGAAHDLGQDRGSGAPRAAPALGAAAPRQTQAPEWQRGRPRRQALHQPRAAEQHRGPEQIAGDGVFQERQRQRHSTGSAPPCRGCTCR